MRIGDFVRYLGQVYVVVDISVENGTLMVQIQIKFGTHGQIVGDAEWVDASAVKVVGVEGL